MGFGSRWVHKKITYLSLHVYIRKKKPQPDKQARALKYIHLKIFYSSYTSHRLNLIQPRKPDFIFQQESLPI